MALFKDPAGLKYNGVALSYSVIGYAVGFAGLFHESWLVNLPATLLLAHSMTIAAYLIHECGHNLVFRKAGHNALLGRALSWICGAAYGTYEDLRYKHFRHHVDNDDVVWFEYDRFFAAHPSVTKITRILEWFYVPAHDVVMHGVMALTSFVIPQRREQRVRNITVILVRGGLFVLLLVFFIRVAALYAVAYLLMMHVLRFMDSVQHDYGYNATLYRYSEPPHKGDFNWEQEHTFSNPISLSFEKLNWLTLNFGYHNAHHYDMNTPWYRLPELHREIFEDTGEWVVPLSAQLKLYHRNRVWRVHSPRRDDYPQGAGYLSAARTGAAAVGGNAASFLTSF